MPRQPTTGSAPASAPAFLENVERQAPSADRLTAIKIKVAELRDKTQELKDLEERVEQVKGEKLALETVTIPDMLAAVGMDKFGLEAEGNNPAYDLAVEPLVRANIAAGWEEPKREAGFRVLRDLGGEALIKTVCIFEFDPADREIAKQFMEKAEALGYLGEEKLSVNHNSMASWLKAEVNADPPRVPSPAQLQAIGGFVGRVAKIKKRRER